MTNQDLELQRAINAMAVPGILIEHRRIESGDEFALLPVEAAAFAKSVTKVRRASGAARIVARRLLDRLGAGARAIPRSVNGAPDWPEDVTGSLAHDGEIAVAAVAFRRDFLSIGVDVEPAVPLEPELLPLIATQDERTSDHARRWHGRLLFAVKEAVYKAVYPLDRTFLDHHDVEVELAKGTAKIRGGRVLPFKYCVASHIVVLAFIPANSVPAAG